MLHFTILGLGCCQIVLGIDILSKMVTQTILVKGESASFKCISTAWSVSETEVVTRK